MWPGFKTSTHSLYKLAARCVFWDGAMRCGNSNVNSIIWSQVQRVFKSAWTLRCGAQCSLCTRQYWGFPSRISNCKRGKQYAMVDWWSKVIILSLINGVALQNHAHCGRMYGLCAWAAKNNNINNYGMIRLMQETTCEVKVKSDIAVLEVGCNRWVG